jgi:hypothetical protein
MANFSWVTAAGPLLTNPISVGDQISAAIVATPEATPSFSIIAGSLPSGLSLINQANYTGLIFGKVTNNYVITTSTFVVRAYSPLFNISIDRSFSITVLPIGAPVWPYGTRDVYLVGPNVNNTFNDFEYVNIPLVANPPTNAPSTYKITYNLTTNSGKLPTGLRLLNTGTLRGLIYNPITSNTTASDTYSFNVAASNGYLSTSQSFIMTVTYVNSNFQAPVFLGNPNLGTYRADSNRIISVGFYNPVPAYGSIVYEQINGSLPYGMNLDTTSGFIYGVLPIQENYLSKYQFEISATKFDAYDLFTTVATQNFSMNVITNNFDTISWVTPSNLGTIHTNVPSNFKVLATHTETIYGLSYFSIGNNFPDGLTLDTSGDILGATSSTGTFTVTIIATTGTVYNSQSWAELTATDNYPVAFSIKSFNINVVTDNLQYTNIYAKPFLTITERLRYQQFVKNTDIFENQYIYRPEDPNFGINSEFKMYIQYGIQRLPSVTDYQSVFLSKPLSNQEKTFYISTTATVVTAVDSVGNPIYDVVYVNVMDYNLKRTVLDKIQNQFLSLLNFKISVSTAFLPSWQSTKGSNFIYGIVLCYAIPGKGEQIINNLKKYAHNLGYFDFGKIIFNIDRFIIEQTISSTSSSYLMLP